MAYEVPHTVNLTVQCSLIDGRRHSISVFLELPTSGELMLCLFLYLASRVGRVAILSSVDPDHLEAR